MQAVLDEKAGGCDGRVVRFVLQMAVERVPRAHPRHADHQQPSSKGNGKKGKGKHGKGKGKGKQAKDPDASANSNQTSSQFQGYCQPTRHGTVASAKETYGKVKGVECWDDESMNVDDNATSWCFAVCNVGDLARLEALCWLTVTRMITSAIFLWQWVSVVM